MTLKRSGELKRSAFKAPLPRTAKPTKPQKPQKRVPKALKTKQLAVTREEKALWNRLAEMGCVACMKDGLYNPHVSIHHVDGRTKPGCHKLVLPLCAPHHQHDDTDAAGRTGVHPWSARFEQKYGPQRELVALCMKLIGEPA